MRRTNELNGNQMERKLLISSQFPGDWPRHGIPGAVWTGGAGSGTPDTSYINFRANRVIKSYPKNSDIGN